MSNIIIVVALALIVGAAAFIFVKNRGGASPAPAPAPPPPTPGASGAKRNWLLGMDGEVDGKNYHVGARSITIGRAPSNLIQLTDSDASRIHARLAPAPGGGLTITDMNSGNGTYVNGDKVKTQKLYDGDQIRITSATFTYRAEGEYQAVQAFRERKAIGRDIEKATAMADEEGLKNMVETALRSNGGNYEMAAEQLGVNAEFIANMVKKYNLKV